MNLHARARHCVAAAMGVLWLGAAPFQFGVHPFDLPSGEYLIHTFARPKTADLRVRYEQCLFWQETIHFACQIRWRHSDKFDEFITADGREGKHYQYLYQLQAIDGSGGAAYLGYDDAGARIVIRGSEGALWKGKGLQYFVLGPDARNYLYLVSEAGKWEYAFNGRPGTSYNGVNSPVFSRNGRSYAYMARTGPNATIAVWNGRQSGPEFNWINSLELSPDGKTFAFVGLRDITNFVVINGVESPAYQSAWQLRFGPDGKTLSYEAWLPDQNPFFVIGGKHVSLENAPAWASWTYPWFGIQDLPPVGERRFRFGDILLPPYSDIRDIRWLPDGRTPVFHVSLKDAEFYVKGTQEEEKHRFAWNLVVAPHDNCIGYKVRDADEERVVACGVTGSPYTQVGPPVFAPYTNDFAYRANLGGTRPPDSGLVEGGRWFVVTNGCEGPDYDMVWDPFFDPQRRRFAYYAFKAGRLFLVLASLD